MNKTTKQVAALVCQELFIQGLVQDKHHHQHAQNDRNCADDYSAASLVQRALAVRGFQHSVGWKKQCYQGCCKLLQLCLLPRLHALCLLQPFAYYTFIMSHHKEGIANLRTSSLCRPARVLLVLVVLDRGGGQGGHGEQGQLHLGYCMAVQQTVCPGKVCLQASCLLLTAPQTSLHCSLHQTQHRTKLRNCKQNAHVQGCMLAS